MSRHRSDAGRCQATKLTVAGRRVPRAASTLYAEHPDGGAVRGHRDERGRITALAADGHPLVIRHVDDAADIDRLFVAAGRSWNRIGFTVAKDADPEVALADGRVMKVCADPAALAGNYPQDCPSELRRQIGDTLARISRRWCIPAEQLRDVRATMIDAAWRRDWGVSPTEMLDVAQREIPALRYLRRSPQTGDPRNLAVYRSGGANVVRVITRAFDDHEDETVPSTLLLWRIATADERAALTVPAVGKRPDLPVIVNHSTTGAVVGHVSIDGTWMTYTEWTPQFLASSVLAREAADARRRQRYCFGCERPQEACRCIRGDAFAREIVADLELDDLTIEHRWGGRYARRPTAEQRRRAVDMAEEVRRDIAGLVGDEVLADFEQQQGHVANEVWADLALFSLQTEHRFDELGPEAATAILDHLNATRDRAQRFHAGYVDTLTELDEAFGDGVVEVFLGRDGRWAHIARQAMHDAGVTRPGRRSIYVSASRAYSTASARAEMTPAIGGDRAVFVDTGFKGTIPERIHEEFGFGASERPGQRSALMRLLSARKEERGFARQLDEHDALVIEFDAKENHSNHRVGVGQDPGLPTSATEQLVARVLDRHVETIARDQAAELASRLTAQALPTPPDVEAHYTASQLRRLRDAGVPEGAIIDGAHRGWSMFELAEEAGVMLGWGTPQASARQVMSTLSSAAPAPSESSVADFYNDLYALAGEPAADDDTSDAKGMARLLDAVLASRSLQRGQENGFDMSTLDGDVGGDFSEFFRALGDHIAVGVVGVPQGAGQPQ